MFMVLVVGVLAAASASAQWARYVPPGTPRTADGRVDLNGPAPRAADGHPDLSGVWDSRIASPRIPAPEITSTGGPPVATFFDVGKNVPGGPPFTPWAAARRAERVAAHDEDNPDAHCLPLGFMQLHTHSQPREIVQTPAMVLIAYEANYGLRHIYTDGRPLPTNDPQPWWYGYSVGHWDGDTLVAETAGLRDEGWLDVAGAPFTSQARITERFHRVTYGRLEIDVTIDDPKAYTHPWTVRVNQRLLPDQQLIEFICNENERSSRHFVR
ncbi:MAG TPA: hypothetical protein VG871_21220 [Vicinamibacterales bacterium]|nr:hypothetical protein [Vicinamibacterales bacterium]